MTKSPRAQRQYSTAKKQVRIDRSGESTGAARNYSVPTTGHPRVAFPGSWVSRCRDTLGLPSVTTAEYFLAALVDSPVFPFLSLYFPPGYATVERVGQYRRGGPRGKIGRWLRGERWCATAVVCDTHVCCQFFRKPALSAAVGEVHG